MALGDKLFVVMGKEKAVPSGVATLDENGILAEAQRPSAAEILTLNGKSVEEALKSAGLPTGGLEGQALVKAGADSETPTKWGPWPSNPNLLINADFRRPVNRNGKSEYLAVGYTIDRWVLPAGNPDAKITIEEDSLYLENNSATKELWLQQNIQYNLDQTVILSILVQELVGQAFLLVPNHYISINNVGIISLSVNGVTASKVVRIALLPNAKVKIKAVKLELGDQQTLAHKDENGNWVLNDPPNYDLQYALCSQYSPITGEFVGSQHSNPNLLDNAYWADKDYIINQRGQNEYTAYGYSIDRYQIIAATLNINNNDITVSAPDDATNSHMVYLFENIPKAQTVTLSMLVDELNGHCYMTGFGKSLTLEPGLNVLTHTIPENYQNNSLYLLNYLQGTIKLKAAKLELGPVQTLAHKDENGNWILNDPPPNKALELAKCQRYQIELKKTNSDSNIGFGIANTTRNVTAFIPLPVSLRNKPIIANQKMVMCMGIFSTGYILQAPVNVSVYSYTSSGIHVNCELVSNDYNFIQGNSYQVYLQLQQSQFLIDANL